MPPAVTKRTAGWHGGASPLERCISLKYRESSDQSAPYMLPAPAQFLNLRLYMEERGLRPLSLAALLSDYLGEDDNQPTAFEEDWMEHHQAVAYRQVIEDFLALLIPDDPE